MMKTTTFKIIITVLSAITLTRSSTAQVENSVYTMFGIGQLFDNSFGINKSMGGTGIAFQSGRSINYMNPASYLGILPRSLNMEFGLYGIYNRSENKNTTQTNGNINFNYFSASACLKNWWASAFGIVPYSNIDYEINTSNYIGGELTSFEKTFKGTGGLSQVFWGNSFRIYKGIAIGFNASYLLGVITQTETANSNESFTGYVLKNQRNTQGYYLDFGLQTIIPVGSWYCTLGLVYGSSKKLNSLDELEFTYDGSTAPLEQDEQADIKIPRKMGVGVSVKRNDSFRAGFDYRWENWFRIHFSNPILDTKNSRRYSIGMEYSNRQQEGWINKFIYRLGVNYKKSYLEINNNQINSIGMNLGIGIPFNKIDICNFSIEYGDEGTLSKRLIKNKYCSFYLNFSLHQIFANRPLRD
jgi:hypothetical protein